MVEVPRAKIGIIELMGKRLYSGNITWLREYIQNAVDAGSSDYILVKLTENDLEIEDHGKGMSQNEVIQQAFSIGGSQKLPSDIGELGIGMYAGSGTCDRLVVLTKKEGLNPVQATLDLALYRRIVRESSDMSFEDGMSRIFGVSESDINIDQKSYTIIRFENLNRETLVGLSEENLLKFLDRTIDLPISDTFPKKNEVENFLCEYRREIKVILSIDGQVSEPKKFESTKITLTDSLIMYDIVSENKELIGKIWAIYNKDGTPPPDARILVKRKGITIGNETYIVSKFKAKYSPRFYGEIVVLDDKIEINTSRDWFVYSQRLNDFVSSARLFLNKLYNIADMDSKIGNGVLKLIQTTEELEKKKKDLEVNGKRSEAAETERKISEKNEKIAIKIGKATEQIEKLKNLPDSTNITTMKLELLQKALDSTKVTNFLNTNDEIKEIAKAPKKHKSPIPRTVLNFLREKIVEPGLANRLKEANDMQSATIKAFIFIEQMLKKKLEIEENEHKELPDLVELFTKKYMPPDNNGFDIGDHKESFKRVILGLNKYLRNPSGHTFMDDMNNPRSMYQLILIADFLAQWIQLWNKE